MLKFLGRSKPNVDCLTTDLLLAAAVLVPLLMYWILSASENAFLQMQTMVAIVLWAAASAGFLLLRRYMPGSNRGSRVKAGKAVLLGVFRSLVIVLSAILGIGLFIGTSSLAAGVRFIVFPLGFTALILASTLVLSLPAMAKDAFLSEEFSLKRTWRYANWSLRKAPLETLSSVLKEILVGLIVWLPVGILLILISARNH